MSKERKKVVCIGGGTGLPLVLSELKKYPLDLSAIVTMFDSGGSTGKLKRELNILPVGDIRQCLLSLSKKDILFDFFNHRFDKGSLRGHNLGNLLIAGLIGIYGNLEEAINKIGKILRIEGKVIPVTLEKAEIEAVLKNNKRIRGEEDIINSKKLSKIGIKKLILNPKVKANPKAISVLKNADIIILGPGKFYTSLISNLLPLGVVEAIRKSSARKIFICNLRTQAGNTDKFKVEDFVNILEEYLGKNVIDCVVFNTRKLPANLLKIVNKVFPKTSFVGYNKKLLTNKKFIGVDIVNTKIRKLNPADILVNGNNQRTMVIHDAKKLANIILKLCKQ